MFSVQEAMGCDPAAFNLLASVALTAFLLNPMSARTQEESPYERIAASCDHRVSLCQVDSVMEDNADL
jgi:hypothetical protein